MEDDLDVVEQLRKEEYLGLLNSSINTVNGFSKLAGASLLSSLMLHKETNDDISIKKDSIKPVMNSDGHSYKLKDKFNLIAENTSDFISITTFSIKPVYTYVNPSFTKYFGFSKEELIGKNSLDFIHPDDLLKLLPILKKYIAIKAKNIISKNEQNFSEKFECRIKDKAGNWHVFQSTANNFGNEIIFIAKDVTTQKNEEERYRRISEVTTDLIYEWDIENNTIDWYGDIDKQLGYEPGEIDRTIKGWISLIHPEDQIRLKDSVKYHMQSTTPIFEEYRIQHNDGTWHYWRDKGTPVLNENGRPIKWIGGCTDITNEKNAERKIKEEKSYTDSILKSLPGVFYLFDEKGRFIRWNKNFEIVTEYSSDELKMMTPIDLFDTDEKQKIASAIQKAFETGYADVKGKFLTKTGKKIPYFFTGVATVYQEKNLLAGVGIDLSNIQQTKTELNKRIKELETVEQLAVNRELKMIKLKKEVNELLKNNGLEEKYEIDES